MLPTVGPAVTSRCANTPTDLRGFRHDHELRRRARTSGSATAPSSAPRAANRSRTPPSGSCARPAARCRSTSPSARASACSSPAWTPSWSSRSPSSRCAGTASTRPSSSPTSCCRSRRSASTSTSSPASVRWWRRRCARWPTSRRSPTSTPEHVPFITEAVRGLVGELGGDPADRLRRRAVHGGVLPRRGRAVEGARPDQGDDVRRPGRLGRADAQDRRHRRGVPRGPGRGRGQRRPAVRLVGRRADAGRLRAARDAALRGGAAPRRRARRAADPLRRRHLQPARPDGRGRRRRGRRRLAYAAGHRRSRRSGTAPSRATSTRPWSSRPPT